MLNDPADILITIKNALRQRSDHIVIVTYDKMDSELELPAGSTKQYISEAAQQTNHKIVNQGSTMIELQKLPTRLIRG